MVNATMEMLDDADYEADYDYLPMTLSLQIPSAIGIGILTFLAIAGNSITIIAYITDKRLHTVYDLYIFNLAMTDLLIGCFSMPFYAVYTLKEFVWIFGAQFCKVWLVIDFTLCLESILIKLILSFDRLQLITYGPHYQSNVTMKKAYIVITFTWVLAFLVYGPFIIAWDHFSEYSTVPDMDCDVAFAHSFEYTTATAIIEFVLPVTCLAVLNSMIYHKIHTRLKQSVSVHPKPTKIHQVPGYDHVSKGLNELEAVNSEQRDIRNMSKIRFDPNSSVDIGKPAKRNCQKVLRKQVTLVKMNSRLKRDFRAARFLAILVIVFLACWAPYTITTIIISFCTGNCINESVYESLNWLLWSKSAINPFLYALNSSRYRYNFKKFILCWKKQALPINTDTTINTAA